MRIKIWAAAKAESPNSGPFRMIDVVEEETLYAVGQMTHFGEVIKITPPIAPFNDEADQSVIVQIDPSSLGTRPDNSIFEKPPSTYNKIEFFPILVDMLGHWSDDPPVTGAHTILAAESLTIENVSPMITPKTFSLWKKNCHITKDTADALDNVKYAIVHRYSSPTERNTELDHRSTDLVNMAVACLALVRPTRRNHAMNVPGVIRPDGTLDPHGFSATHDPADVPEIQKLFTVRKRDIDLLSSVLPEFIQLYRKDGRGRIRDEYEPLRMAAQLYEQAYAISYWKARHILWWSAIEALYGDNEYAATARIYAFFGNKRLEDGYRRPIYENNDIPSCYAPTPDCIHTLGKMVPLIYKVRNASAHGQRVRDTHFIPVAHPFGQSVSEIDVLAEAATFIIRKTVIGILQQGLREKFKDRDAQESFWLYEYGLDKKQSKKRLNEMEESLGHI